MKNLYDISTGQMIVLWAFGAFAWVWAINNSDYWYGGYLSTNHRLELSDVASWLIPLVLIFYFVGWRNNRKKAQGN